MTAILKVDTIQDTSGNNIINENANTITIGASGDTVDIPSGVTFDVTGATVTGLSAGITMSDSWILDADVTISGSNILLNTSSLVRSSVPTTGFIGTGMSYSSGYFTFPSTGIYQITVYYDITTTASQDLSLKIWTTTDNSTYNQRTAAYTYAVANVLTSGVSNFVFDVTDTSTHKVGLYYYAVGGGTTKLRGNASQAETQITFTRLGDT